MFTGIIEELGTVDALDVDAATDSAQLRLTAHDVLDGVADGDSIAVNGVCLTVIAHTATGYTVDVMAETLHRTALGQLRPGDRVNLERAVAADGRLGGHIVQGHVDGVGHLLDREHTPAWDTVSILLPAALRRYVVEKGSIAVDGVSLTVAGVDDGPPPGCDASLHIGLIPTTLARTTLGLRQPGDPVHLEVDVLAKYVEKLLPTRAIGQDVPPGGTTVAGRI